MRMMHCYRSRDLTDVFFANKSDEGPIPAAKGLWRIAVRDGARGGFPNSGRFFQQFPVYFVMN